MSLNKSTSWLQAAVVASSMLLPGACAEKKAPEPFKMFDTDCEFKKLPTDLPEILDWIAKQIREICPESFDETDGLFSGGNCKISRIGDATSIVSSSLLTNNEEKNPEKETLFALMTIRNNRETNTKILEGIYHGECNNVEGNGNTIRMSQRVNVDLVDLGIPGDDGLKGTSRETEELRLEIPEDEKGITGSITFKTNYENRGSISPEEALKIFREKFGIYISF